MSHNPTTPPGGPLPVLDLDGACEFLELSRDEIMVLVPQAMIEIHEKIGLAHQAIATADYSETVLHAHTIKSIAASIGAPAVRHAAEALESHARTPAPDNCLHLAEILTREIAHLTQAVDDLPK